MDNLSMRNRRKLQLGRQIEQYIEADARAAETTESHSSLSAEYGNLNQSRQQFAQQHS